MKRFMAKLGFVHRTLWQREHAYRWAALFGPPPLMGCAVAFLVWTGTQRLGAHAPPDTPDGNVPWAHWTRPVAQGGQPFGEMPNAPLPQRDASGGYVGFQPGWAGAIQPMTVDATMDVNVVATSLGSFTLDQPTIPLARVGDAGPPTGLFVGTGRTFFTVRTGGLYAFSARLARTGTQSANCVVRLGSAHHRILRNVVLGAAGDAVLNFPSTEFRLDPGLFLLQVAVGCWRGDSMNGSGELILMVRRPGDAASRPAAADELVRPVPRPGSGVSSDIPAAR